MKHAIAIWNFSWEAQALPQWINAFADQGCNAISFHPRQFSGEQSRYLPAAFKALYDRDLVATVHGSCAAAEADRELYRTIVEAMGARLHAFTLDSAKCEDSRGRFHDARRIADALGYLQHLTEGTAAWVAVEDFPLDDLALAHFLPDLERVYDHPRTGILIDVGHMHIRMKKEPYFGRKTMLDYFRDPPRPLIEVHLHDNDGESDQHGHFGFGSVPFAEVAQSLKALNFDGVCTVEIAPKFHGSTPDASLGKAIESLQQWRALMR